MMVYYPDKEQEGCGVKSSELRIKTKVLNDSNSMFLFFFLILITILPSTVTANDGEMIQIGKDAFAFHKDKFPEEWIKLSRPFVRDSEIFIELIGLNNIGKINQLKLGILRSDGINNAVALFKDGFRLIVFDPNWAKTIGPEFYLVLGHEAGHHFCEHTLSMNKRNPLDMELQADRFAGAAIKRFEAYHNKKFLEDVIKAASVKYQKSGSRSHPSRKKRVEAILLGYNNGSPCANLAPGVSGYSRGQR